MDLATEYSQFTMSLESDFLNAGDLLLVTGGAGYIGSLLVELLVEKGYRVRILDCFLYGKESLQNYSDNSLVEIQDGNICNIDDVSRALQGVKVVIALAAIVGDPACRINKEKTININLHSTKLLCQLVNENPSIERVVFASSCSVYGSLSNQILNEDSPTCPVSLYAKTRIESERILSKNLNNSSLVILRLGTVFGVSRRMRFDLMVNKMTFDAVDSGIVNVYGGNSFRPHVSVFDVAKAFSLAAEAPQELVDYPKVYNVGSNDENHTIEAVAKIVKSVLPNTEINQFQIDDMRDYNVRFDRIEEELKFSPTYSVRDGVNFILDFFSSRKFESGNIRYWNAKYLESINFGKTKNR